MADTSSTRTEIARRIVEYEAGGSHDRAATAAALEMAVSRLRHHLVDLLGASGVAALLRRALHLARRQQTILSGVTASGESAAWFSGLTESLAAASTDQEATAAAAAILAHVFDLLVMLLGDELGMKPIRKFWPQATRDREMD